MCAPDMPDLPDPPSPIRSPRINADDLFGSRSIRNDPRWRGGYRGTISSAVGVLASNAQNQKRALGS